MAYVLHVVNQTIAGSLGTDVAASPCQTLASEDADPLVAEFLVLAEHVRDLAGASADVARGDVGVGTNVPLELGHEGNTETADLAVRLALGVEVGAALAAAHGEPGERILERLLKAEELEDGQADEVTQLFKHAISHGLWLEYALDGGVQAETTLVRTKRGVVLVSAEGQIASSESVSVYSPAHGSPG